VVTAIIQSSSLTTVLVVGFISAGLMTLQQSVGVIMGANIGTTLTVQVAAFKITESAWLLVALGFAALTFGRRNIARDLGSMLIGLGMLFLALEQMSAATGPLRTYQPFLHLMQRLEYPALGIVVGAAFTALVQSSTATTGVVLALAGQGLLALPAALALGLGANLGSCVTALLASIGKPIEARQAALVHLLFNGIGVAVWSFFLPQLAALVQWTAADLPRQFANAHTIFNVATTAVMIWWAGPLARAAQWLAPGRPQPTEPPAKFVPRYLDEGLMETPSLALDRARLEIGSMGDVVLSMIVQAGPAVLTGTQAELATVAAMDNEVGQRYVAIVEYLRRLAREQLTTAESAAFEDCLAAANYLESASDIIAISLIVQGQRRLEHGLKISPSTAKFLMELFATIHDVLRRGVLAFCERDQAVAQQVIASKSDFQLQAHMALEQLRQRLLTDEPGRIFTFQLEVELVAQLQRLHTLARRLAKLVAPTDAER
jgi:phosphate:Na+ symporter